MIENRVADYIEQFRSRAKAEAAEYTACSTLEDAVRAAARCRTQNGKRHSHQRRIPSEVLLEAEKALVKQTSPIEASKTFEELHAAVNAIISPIHGIGPLSVYDISIRIGSFLGLEPELVYLHAGAKEGAKKLGIKGQVVPKHDFPEAFEPLSPAEIEDCLCIFKCSFFDHDNLPDSCRTPARPRGC